MEKQDMEGRFAAEATSRPKTRVTVLAEEESFSCWACSSSLATCAALETCLHPPGGRGGGRVQRVGLTGVLIRLGWRQS